MNTSEPSEILKRDRTNIYTFLFQKIRCLKERVCVRAGGGVKGERE